MRGPAFFAYADNYLIDLKCGIIMDVEASRAIRQAEVGAAKTMIERTEERFNIKPERLAADTAYGSAPTVDWLVNDKKMAPHIPVIDMAKREDGIFSREDFTHDKVRDVYTCPAGKPPLRQKHVWAIRTKLQIDKRTRDLAMFNLAIDSKLRGCDVVALKVEDVAPNGYCADRATVRQRKTGRPVRFELTEQSRQAVDDYIKSAGKKPGEFLFTARRRQEDRMPTRHYARLLSGWIASIGLDPHQFGNHFLATNKGDADLPPDRQPASRAAIARPYQD